MNRRIGISLLALCALLVLMRQSAPAVFLPPAPRLRAQITSTNTVMISWSYQAGFGLLATTNLVNWVAAPETVRSNALVNYVIVTPPAGRRFYRLVYP
jgi:hypothetical protein